MSSRNSKNDKVLQEKFQSLLSFMLREEDNKYCADCDAKGPRWASWNLGIFVCIRCAGIHRNLGVHISRVKSVNLDSWTSEQVGSMQAMGNSKGRAVYEANLPDGYRRPQTDSDLETFIRAKYEHKKYIAKEWIPPTSPIKADFSVLGGPAPAATSGTSSKAAAGDRNKKIEINNVSVPRPHSCGNLQDAATTPAATTPVTPSASNNSNTSGDDLFNDFISAPVASATSNGNIIPTSAPKSVESEEKDFFNQVQPGNNATTPLGNGASQKFDKDSILSLYAKAPVQTNLLAGAQTNPMIQTQVPLNINPQLAQNNPFLMGGMPPAPPVMGMGQPLAGGYVMPQQQMQMPMMAPHMGAAPLMGAPQMGVAPNLMAAPTPMSNSSLLNSQMAGLQLGGAPNNQMNGQSLSTNFWN